MKLSVLAVALGDRSLDEALKFLSDRGVHAVEIGCGGFPGKAHCDPEVLLHDEKKLQEFKDTFKKYNMEISALSAHGNAVHPDKAQARKYEDDFVNAILLAEKLGVDRVVTFSGCPGGSKDDKTPNWVTCAWPQDYPAILDYQWNEVLIPYWKKMAAFANDHGIYKIAFEMHPGFCVYNPETMLRIREAVGSTLGANLDPSHLFWQGIDPCEAVRYLGGDAIHFIHAKDTALNQFNIAHNGVLDTKNFTKVRERSWIFRTVGYGHDEKMWKDFVSALRLAGYEGPVSIEHEDGLMSGEEGLTKAIRLMQDVMMATTPGDMYWA
ncbi:MAG: sugar phosphate isomerase/epimerase [Clostridiales bacterium]|nr:sugar phosphate isomerase/epimerase [Clostridiales bacterium]